MADIFNIAGEINSTSQEGTAVHANQVKDDLQNKKQSQINEEVGEELELHTNRLNALTGQNYTTVQATQSTTAADIPTLINASGEGEQTDTIYRVGFWDGSAYVADKYTEYAWNGTAYVILDVKSSIGEVFDISQYNAVGGTLTTYADLEAALGVDGANVPSSVRRGGMSIKFVCSSDNKYVQYFLTKDEWSTTESDWQIEASPSGFLDVNAYNNKLDSYATFQDALDAIPVYLRRNRLVVYALVADKLIAKIHYGSSASNWTSQYFVPFISDGNSFGDSIIGNRHLDNALKKSLNNTTSVLGIAYKDIQTAQTGKIINADGTVVDVPTGYISEEFNLSKGQRIGASIAGGSGYSVFAKVSGGSYTPLVVAKANQSRYQYTADDDMTVVVCNAGGVPYVYFYSQETTDAFDENFTTTDNTTGVIRASDVTAGNAYYRTIQNVIFNRYNRFEKVDILLAAATTLNVCILDASTNLMIYKKPVSIQSAGTVTINDYELDYDFDSERDVRIWFMTDTYPSVTYANYQGAHFETLISLGSVPTVANDKNLNVKFYFKKVDYNKQGYDTTIMSEKVFPSVENIQEYINRNRDCFIPAGIYTIDTALTIPANTHIHGIKGATILQLGSADTIFNLDASSKHITINNLTFIGKTDVNYASGTTLGYDEIKNRTGIGSDAAIVITGDAENVNIENCDFSKFGKTAIHFNNTIVPTDGKATKICGIDVTKSYAGMIFEGTTTYQNNSEYMSVVNSHFETCKIGVLILAANNIIDACQFKHNRVGIAIVGTNVANDGHGIISNCMANHCMNGSLVCIDIQYGYTITGCHLIDGGGTTPTYAAGGIRLSNSKGIHIVGGNISTAINIDNEANDGINLIQCVMFTKGYGGGVINGSPTKLALNGNRFLDGSDYSTINNTL